MTYELVIGLEIHLKLNSNTKIFCSCRNEQDFIKTKPNTNICPFCTAQPGALPVLQKNAVQKALTLARTLNCEIQNPSHFDRKSYFYPDQPAGYQITQFFTPYAINGKVRFWDEKFEHQTTIGIHEAHMETDTAKTIHDGDDSFIDFNRAGTPLVEIVTNPDFRSADEVIGFLKEIQRLARFNNIGDADLEKGQMRVDVNLSVRELGKTNYGTRIEIKNINTFSNIKLAIAHEYARQIELIQGGGIVEQETRRWDVDSGTTILMRSKENALDYRYFPEPDLPPLLLDEQLLDEMEAQEIIITSDFIEKYKNYYSFHKEYINVLISSEKIHHRFHDIIQHDVDPTLVIKRIAGPIVSHLHDKFVDIDELPITKDNFVRFLNLVQDKKISHSQAKIVMKEMLSSGENPERIVENKGFDQEGLNEGQLQTIIHDIIAKNPNAVADYQGGKESAIKFLMGQVMRETKGQAGHNQVTKLLSHTLQNLPT